MKIGIDPGHGGKDPGAIGQGGLFEKTVTLAVSLELSCLLQAAGMETFLTRSDDRTMGLVTRSALINNMGCDLAVSVHCNSSPNHDADYISTFIQGVDGEAEKLAAKVQPRLVAATGWEDGGVRVDNLHMTRETKMPAILCECGFISNSAQEKQFELPDTPRRLAQAIAAGVLDYLGIEIKGGTELKIGMEIAETKVIMDGKDAAKSVILNVDGRDTTYIPAVVLREHGFAVNWDAATKTVTISKLST